MKSRLEMEREDLALSIDSHVLHCDCGKTARSFCGVATEPQGHLHHPQPCRLPVCGDNGGCCDTHRHAPGTMGYLPPSHEVRFEARKFSGSTIWDKIVALWRNTFWDEPRTAEWIWQGYVRDNCRPPAPLPQNFIVIFQATGRQYRRSRFLRTPQWDDLSD